MKIIAPDHPLLRSKISILRDRDRSSKEFAQVAREIVLMLAVWSTQDFKTKPISIQTPVAEATGDQLVTANPLVVPVLRAGLGMLDAFRILLPESEVGFIGAGRDEETLDAALYGVRLPESIQHRPVFLLDPMLATGGTLELAIAELRRRAATDITIVCLIAAPEGIERLRQSSNGDLTLVVGCIDSHLNEKGYIVPGLGDAGDRLFGTFS